MRIMQRGHKIVLAGVLTALMPVGKGISKTRARKDMTKMFAEWADAKTYSARHAGRPAVRVAVGRFASVARLRHRNNVREHRMVPPGADEPCAG